MINAFGLERAAASGLACRRNTDERKEVEDRERDSKRETERQRLFSSLQPLALKGPDPEVSSTIYRGGEAISSMLRCGQETV